jgi:predicted ATPase/class 3 adenylate cyclase
MSPLPTGTVTFIFTDIEGSTDHLQRLGERYAALLGQHQALLRAAFASHDGHVVDTQGDAFFVAFARAPDAVAASVVAQRALADYTWPEGGSVRVRMGLHTGAPQLVGDHYVGLDVHRAARIASAGHGGQVLLSEATRVLSEQALPTSSTLRDLGLHRLKDLQQPEHLFQLIAPGVASDFPPLKTLDRHTHNLPIQPTPLIGRESEVATTATLVRRDDVRLVTLTGPGGTGKTRLGLQIAAELVDAFSDGVWFVRLARLTDPALVVSTIAQTLGLRETATRPIAELLLDYVRPRALLLVLDNFEHVVAAAPDLAALLEASPGLKVLVTSRVVLHLRGEKEVPVSPLALPALQTTSRRQAALDAVTHSPAAALFLQRAQDARPDFHVTPATAPSLAAICIRLDGLPLAIELAAAKVKLLPPSALLTRLERQLPVLTGGARDLEERQQTMRATISWSHDLLSPAEQVLFRRLAVFAGSGTLEAAEAICVAPKWAEPMDLDLLEGMGSLVDQNLVQQREEGDEARFGLLHVIREYALEQLEACDGLDEHDGHDEHDERAEPEALRRAHAVYFLALAERAESELTGPDVGAWMDRLEREHDNLRAALGWAQTRAEVDTGLRLVAALWRFWWVRGHLREGRAWVETLLALAGEAPSEPSAAGAAASTSDDNTVAEDKVHIVPDSVRARALYAGGALAAWLGEDAAAETRQEQAAALGRVSGDLRTTARALNSLGIIAQRNGELERAATRYSASLAVAREVGDPRDIAVALSNLGEVAYYHGDLERAAAAYEEALTLMRQLGDPESIAVGLDNHGRVARQRGNLAQAEALHREAAAHYRELRDPGRCAESLEALGSTAGVKGQGARAARLLGAAAAVRAALGSPQPPVERTDTEQAVAAARAALGEEEWALAFAAGQALTLEEALAAALDEPD